MDSLRRSKNLKLASGLALLVLASVLGWKLHAESELPRRFAIVEPGRLYRSGQPTPAQLARVLDRYDIRTVLELRPPNYPEFAAEKQLVEERGAELVVVPISSRDPLTPDQLEAIHSLYADAGRQPILVHCRHGVARTGVAVALWRLEHDGWNGERAVREMIERGYPVRDENAAMRDRLESWEAHE